MSHKAKCLRCRWSVKSSCDRLLTAAIHEHHDHTGHRIHVTRKKT